MKDNKKHLQKKKLNFEELRIYGIFFFFFFFLLLFFFFLFFFFFNIIAEVLKMKPNSHPKF